MALTTQTVNDTLYYPDGTPMAGAFITFTLVGTGTSPEDSGTIPPSTYTETTSSGGFFSVNLWPNVLGYAGTNYKVEVSYTDTTTGKYITKKAGTIQVPDEVGPHDLSELLELGSIAGGAFYLGLITQEQYDRILLAESNSLAAELATEADADVASNAASQSIVARNQTQAIADAAASPSGESLPTLPNVDYPVSSYFRLFSGPGTRIYRNDSDVWVDTGFWARGPEFDTVPQLLEDVSQYPEGSLIKTVEEGFVFPVLASGATDQQFTTAGGVKLKRHDLLDREVTVGTGGDFSNIGEALTAVSNQPRGYIYPNADVTIRLLTGFEMDEQVVVVNGQDLSYVRIISDDAVVNASRAALVVDSNTIPELDAVETSRGFFMAGNYGRLPRIGCVFSMDTDGTESPFNCGLYVTRGASALIESGAGFWDTDGNGAVAYHAAKIVANDTIWQRNGRAKPSTALDLSAIRGAFQSTISASDALIEDSNDCGILSIGASIATFRNTTITNAARHGLYVGSVSNTHARGMVITGCGAAGINATEGSMTRLIQSTITGNTANGISMGENSVINSATGTTISNNGASGVRVTQGSRFSASSPTIDDNGNDGVSAEAGDVYISGGSVKNNAGNDLEVSGGGVIRLSGTVATTSGTNADANVTDSNVAALNAWSASAGGGAIYGRGGKSANRGTASIASGATSVTVTHGVGFSPLVSEVSVTPTNFLGLANKFKVNPALVTDTQFTIEVDVAPGAGGASFGWHVARIFD